MQDVAGKHDEVGVFGQGGVEHLLGRGVGRVEEQVAEMVGHLGHAHQRLLPSGSRRHG